MYQQQPQPCVLSPYSRRTRGSLLLLLALVLWAHTDVQVQTRQQDIARLQTDDRQWIMPAKHYASTRYSSRNQITIELPQHTAREGLLRFSRCRKGIG